MVKRFGTWNEAHEEVDVTVRPRLVTQHRTKQGEPLYTESSDLWRRCDQAFNRLFPSKRRYVHQTTVASIKLVAKRVTVGITPGLSGEARLPKIGTTLLEAKSLTSVRTLLEQGASSTSTRCYAALHDGLTWTLS